MTSVPAYQRNSPLGLDEALATVLEAYRARTPYSAAHFTEAASVLPGGNTRTVIFSQPYPIYMRRGESAHLWDVDGNRYVNMLGEFTAGIFGHSEPVVREAIMAALDGGLNLSGHSPIEARLAALLCERFPSLNLVRFTNSGTEANMMALVTARAITGRQEVVVFERGYHGATLSFPPGGAPTNAPFDFTILPYNDVAAFQRAMKEQGSQTAAILVEPMLGAGGGLLATQDFLQALRSAATEHGIVLIFDEVQTSRLSPGGWQEVSGIVPDMTTLGKYLGGGLSFGAFGGRKDIMERFDPRRADALTHAGTFNNNVLTMHAGVAVLTKLLTVERLAALNARGDALRASLQSIFERHDAPFISTGFGSIINVRPKPSVREGQKLGSLLYHDLLSRGFYIAERGFLALSFAVSAEQIADFVAAIDDILEERLPLLAALDHDVA